MSPLWLYRQIPLQSPPFLSLLFATEPGHRTHALAKLDTLLFSKLAPDFPTHWGPCSSYVQPTSALLHISALWYSVHLSRGAQSPPLNVPLPDRVRSLLLLSIPCGACTLRHLQFLSCIFKLNYSSFRSVESRKPMLFVLIFPANSSLAYHHVHNHAIFKSACA